MTWVWKRKRTCSSVAWRMCGSARERTMWLQSQWTLTSHPTPPHHNFLKWARLHVRFLTRWQKHAKKQEESGGPGYVAGVVVVDCWHHLWPMRWHLPFLDNHSTVLLSKGRSGFEPNQKPPFTPEKNVFWDNPGWVRKFQGKWLNGNFVAMLRNKYSETIGKIDLGLLKMVGYIYIYKYNITILYYIMLYYVILYHIISYYIILI